MALGELPLSADVLVPDDGERVPAGTLEVLGYALAGGNRYVARVDVSADGGTNFREAELWRTRAAGRGGCGERRSSSSRARTSSWCAPGTAPAPPSPRMPSAVWNPKGYVNSSWARVSVVALSGLTVRPCSESSISAASRRSRVSARFALITHQVACLAVGRRALLEPLPRLAVRAEAPLLLGLQLHRLLLVRRPGGHVAARLERRDARGPHAPASVSSATRATFTLLHLLVFARGVKRIL